MEGEDVSEVVMAIKHKEFPCYGVQFHPESIMTAQGEQLIRNFLHEAGAVLKQTIEKLIFREDLTKEESSLAIHEALGDANPFQTAAFLVLMRAKGETVEEIQGVIEAMRSLMVRVPLSCPVLDIVGTGGDGAHTLNISTASAILAASCGVEIAKHGNRSVSSLAGSADVLEAVGVDIHQTPEQIKRCIEEIGIGFMFAPDFHPALKDLKEIRKGLSVRTLFNIIGPLLNPAGAEHLMLGVFSEDLMEIAADLLLRLKSRRSARLPRQRAG